MRQLFRTAIILQSTILMSLFSCRHRQGGEQASANSEPINAETAFRDTTVVQGNVTTVFSTDIDRLGKLLDFKKYRPVKVRFKYIFRNNSGQNRRLTVPGPSDYSLQALLYFDSLTFEQFSEFDRHADYSSPDYNKADFAFNWLDKEILTELENSDKDYRGHPDFFFGTANGKLWYLDGKILLANSTH